MKLSFFPFFYNVEPTKLIYGIKKRNENEFFCFFFHNRGPNKFIFNAISQYIPLISITYVTMV